MTHTTKNSTKAKQDALEAAIGQHRLPADFSHTIDQWYRPLAKKIVSKRGLGNRTFVLGIQGTQGSGKSTLAEFLRIIFEQEHELSSAVLSIDDFYLKRCERERLASDVHPLLITRGVPGTHDLGLATKALQNLSQLRANDSMQLIRFDKALDDRAEEAHWPTIHGPVNIVILEGWCIGLPPQKDERLNTPVNALEQDEDPNGTWRRYVNRQLATGYQELFQALDALTVLSAPSFECVYEWRLLQEQKLMEKQRGFEQNAPVPVSDTTSHLLSPNQVKRFISHYQRLTEHGLQTLPGKADWLLPLNGQHEITALREKDTA